MAEKNKDLFQKIGVDISNDKINIDLTKTKDFLNSLHNTLEEKAQIIQKDISEGKIDLGENFIEDFGKKIENFIGEIDKTADNIVKK